MKKYTVDNHPDRLTGREIEIIYKKEISMYKVNILENDICIDTAIVTKEKALEVQSVLQHKNKSSERLKQGNDMSVKQLKKRLQNYWDIQFFKL